jgi:hypothetical protein
MSLIDIKAIKEQANAEFAKERTEAIKKKLIAQMRVVDQARQVLRGEEMKLADLEAQAVDGTLRTN